MSAASGRNIPGDTCLHQQTVDDDREGHSVCLLCGLVLEQLYQQQDRRETLIQTSPEKMREEEDPVCKFLLDVAAHAEIPKSVISYAMSYLKKIQYQLMWHEPRFSDKTLASYALYETLSRNSISRTAEEIAFFTQCKLTKLWAVESALNLKDTLNHPLDYVERFCTLLDLEFQEMKTIRGIVGNMFGWGGIRPQCVVAVVIYLYCKELNKKLSLVKICEMCDVSSTNIYAIIRKMKKPYVEKISLLYT